MHHDLTRVMEDEWLATGVVLAETSELHPIDGSNV